MVISTPVELQLEYDNHVSIN